MERRRIASRTSDAPLIDNEQSADPPPSQHSLPLSDRLSISILLFLYLLQGIPMGLAGSIPMILQNRGVSYSDQAIFSFVNWPFSIKLLWAPLVDAWYWRRLGRRKSWLIPSQYLLGLAMLLLSSRVDSLIGGETQSPNVPILTAAFFAMYFLAATQDIAVDGWALTMLSRQNVGYASVCNAVGATAGYFLGNIVFLAFESADFCNKYLRTIPQSEGLITLAGFLQFWGIIFFITTTIILFLKREREETPSNESSIRETYSQLYRIMCLRNIQLVVIFLLTAKVAFSAPDSVTGLKLLEAGVPKEHIALLAVPMVPLQIVLPLVVAKYISGPKPLTIYLCAYPFRLLLGSTLAGLVWWAHQVKTESGFPTYFYVVTLLIYALHQVAVNGCFVAQMSFFAQISDPAIGGTYMTLLNTVANLGANWPSTLALALVDPLSTKSSCSLLAGSNDCATPQLVEQCVSAGGTCSAGVDGYYLEVVACAVLGILWLQWGRPVVNKLSNLPMTAWQCPR